MPRRCRHDVALERCGGYRLPAFPFTPPHLTHTYRLFGSIRCVGLHQTTLRGLCGRQRLRTHTPAHAYHTPHFKTPTHIFWWVAFTAHRASGFARFASPYTYIVHWLPARLFVPHRLLRTFAGGAHVTFSPLPTTCPTLPHPPHTHAAVPPHRAYLPPALPLVWLHVLGCHSTWVNVVRRLLATFTLTL